MLITATLSGMKTICPNGKYLTYLISYTKVSFILNPLIKSHHTNNNTNNNKNNRFADDEKLHNVPQLPITKDEVEEMKAKWKAINARPIKKVLEAKARKKHRVWHCPPPSTQKNTLLIPPLTLSVFCSR